MSARHSDRVRRLLRLRARPEAVIQAATHTQLKRGWRALYPRLRGLRKQGDVLDGWYDDWAGEFAAALLVALNEASGVLAVSESAFWSEQSGNALDLDPYQIVRDYADSIGARIGAGAKGNEITETTRQMVADAVQAWYSAPEMSLAELAGQLGFAFSPMRAQIIARNETTQLTSAVTKDVMTRLGLNRWSWQTRQEWNTCKEICAPKHGVIYSLGDPMPTDGSHIACMCTASPVVE